MLSLVEPLRALGAEIRYDQVVLSIGDSLIHKIAAEIADGDFLIAIVSPDSVASEWCRRELSLAATLGINEKRVKVLPVRFRSAEMPLLLQDTFWADADHDTVETIARQPAASMKANLEGRAEEADAAAAAAERAQGQPPHAERLGDVGVAQIDEVADRCWDVFAAWVGVWQRRGNLADLDDPQRRLRWTVERLPEQVRVALPLVQVLANTSGDQFFENADNVEEPERQIRDELTAVRTRVAQGLPIPRRWLVTGNYGEVDPGNRDATAHLWEITRGGESRRVTVFISGTAIATDNRWLPAETVAAKNTRGRSVLAGLVGLDDPPIQVMATTAGISLSLPD